MDANRVAATHAAYFTDRIPDIFLGHKLPERRAAVAESVGAYCRDVLPELLIDRRDPMVTRIDEFDGSESGDQ